MHHISITRYFKRLVYFFSSPSFYNVHVGFPTSHTPVSSKILDDHHFQFFEKCIGAVDGSHICVFSATDEHAFMRNHKGYLSQNCLFTCNFNFNFIYSLCGWDGLVANSALWRDAIENDIEVPIGRYLLGDAFLVPYRGVRYYLKEWRQGRIGYVQFSLTFHSSVIIPRPL